MISSKGLLAGATVALFLASASTGEAAKWSIFGLGGGQDTPPANTGGQTVQADADRINQLESQVRDLTGQVETLTHTLQQLQDQLKRMQADSEFRFSQLEGGKGVKPTAPPSQSASTPPLPVPDAAAAPAPDTKVVQLDSAATSTAPSGAGRLDAPAGGDTPLDLSSIAGGVDQSAAATPPAATDSGAVQVASLGGSGDPHTDYEQAYGLVNNGQYDLAAQAFKKFLATYPKDDLAPDAQYWLGESLFARGDYASAAQEFKAGFQTYPKSKRAPELAAQARFVDGRARVPHRGLQDVCAGAEGIPADAERPSPAGEDRTGERGLLLTTPAMRGPT